MNTLEKQDALKRCDVLARATAEGLRSLAEAAEIECIDAGAVVFDAGDTSSRVYVVASGSLEVRLSEGTKLVSFFEPGALFGEYAMFVGVRTARVTAAKPTVLLSLDSEHFRSFLLQCPECTLQLLQTAVRRLQRAERQRE